MSEALLTPKVGSLFAGYGGLSLAVEQVFGAELAWYADVCKLGNGVVTQQCVAALVEVLSWEAVA